MKVSLILPAFNEREKIQGTIREAAAYFRMRGCPFQIIVSADGTDGTRELANSLRKEISELIVVGESERKGKGFGVKRAVMMADGDVVGYADADNKTPISELDKCFPYFESGASVVIGVRDFTQSSLIRSRKWYRRFGSWAFNRLVRGVMGLGEVRELQCGFKFFSREVAQKLFQNISTSGYMFDVELLRLARRLKQKIHQVEVLWNDDQDSRLEMVSGNLKNLVELFRIRFRRYDGLRA